MSEPGNPSALRPAGPASGASSGPAAPGRASVHASFERQKKLTLALEGRRQAELREATRELEEASRAKAEASRPRRMIVAVALGIASYLSLAFLWSCYLRAVSPQGTVSGGYFGIGFESVVFTALRLGRLCMIGCVVFAASAMDGGRRAVRVSGLILIALTLAPQLAVFVWLLPVL